MKIWIVAGEYPTPRRPIAGPFVRDQVEALRDLGHEVHVIHRDPPTLRRAAQLVKGLIRRFRPGGTVSVVGPVDPASAALDAVDPASARPIRSGLRYLHDSCGRTIATAQMLVDMRHLARQHGMPHILHAHNVWPAGVAARAWGRRHDRSYLITEHTSSFLREQLVPPELRQARAVFDDAAQVLAVSAAQAAALPASDVVVIPNVVDTAAFSLRHADARVNGPIVTIGRLVPMKGVAAVIRAFNLLPAAIQEAHPLVVVGDGPEEGHLRTLAGVGVTFTGHLLPAEVATLLQDSSLVVSASRVETFGVTLIEALAAGVPFVATRSGGPDDIWTPVAGLMVELDHTDQELADAMQAVLVDDDLQARDGERRADAVARFSGPAIGSALESLYSRMLSR